MKKNTPFNMVLFTCLPVKMMKPRLFQLLLLFFLLLLSGGCSSNEEDLQQSNPIQSSSPTAQPENIQETPVLPTPTLLPTMAVPTEEQPVEVTQSSPTQQQETEETPTIDEIPSEYFIWDIWGHKQYFSLGCETSAAIDWATYFGHTINEFEFQTKIPLSDNPDLGFVGSVDGPWGQVPPYAYGVHADPIAAVLQEYGVNAKGEKGFTIEQIKYEIANDRPVIAWVIGNCVGGIPYEYTDSNGNTSIVAAYEHVIIVTGYTETTIRYMNNGKFYDTPVEVFENSWSVLGNMVVYLLPE